MRILITGITGFIGSRLADWLKNAGHEIWGLSRQNIEGISCLVVDLLDQESVKKNIAEAPHFDAVLHLAAIAHGEKPPLSYDIESVNIVMTDNLLKSLKKNLHFIFFSSVAVYSESGQQKFVTPFADTHPLTAYGKGKLSCEMLVIQKKFKKVDIIRLPPVFDSSFLVDVKKRVFIPFTGIRFIIYPNPIYSLCSTKKICLSISRLLSDGDHFNKILHIADDKLYSQKELASWFTGPVITFSIFFLFPFLKWNYHVSKCKKIRYYLRKLLLDNYYSTKSFKEV